MAQPCVYILKSARNGRCYGGHTTNIDRRVATHTAGGVRATRYLRPWALVYTEEHPDATAARKRERYLKRLKSRAVLRGAHSFSHLERSSVSGRSLVWVVSADG